MCTFCRSCKYSSDSLVRVPPACRVTPVSQNQGQAGSACLCAIIPSGFNLLQLDSVNSNALPLWNDLGFVFGVQLLSHYYWTVWVTLISRLRPDNLPLKPVLNLTQLLNPALLYDLYHTSWFFAMWWFCLRILPQFWQTQYVQFSHNNQMSIEIDSLVICYIIAG